MKQLQDTDWMPWGKYGPSKGDPRRMEDVPARYLHFLWAEAGLKAEVQIQPVAEYIQRNMSGLQQEYPDGIWE